MVHNAQYAPLLDFASWTLVAVSEPQKKPRRRRGGGWRRRRGGDDDDDDEDDQVTVHCTIEVVSEATDDGDGDGDGGATTRYVWSFSQQPLSSARADVWLTDSVRRV